MDRATVRWLRMPLDASIRELRHKGFLIGGRRCVLKVSCLLKTWSQKANQRSCCGPTNGHRSKGLTPFQPSLQGIFRTGMKQLLFFEALDSLDTLECSGIWIGSRGKKSTGHRGFLWVCLQMVDTPKPPTFCPCSIRKWWLNLGFGGALFSGKAVPGSSLKFQTDTSTSPVEEGAGRGIPWCQATRPANAGIFESVHAV